MPHDQLAGVTRRAYVQRENGSWRGRVRPRAQVRPSPGGTRLGPSGAAGRTASERAASRDRGPRRGCARSAEALDRACRPRPTGRRARARWRRPRRRAAGGSDSSADTRSTRSASPLGRGERARSTRSSTAPVGRRPRHAAAASSDGRMQDGVVLQRGPLERPVAGTSTVRVAATTWSRADVAVGADAMREVLGRLVRARGRRTGRGSDARATAAPRLASAGRSGWPSASPGRAHRAADVEQVVVDLVRPCAARPRAADRSAVLGVVVRRRRDAH